MINKTETSEKDSVNKENDRNIPHFRQLNVNAYTENTDILRQSGNGTSDNSNAILKLKIEKLSLP